MAADLRGSFTDGASTDVAADFRPRDGIHHRRHGLWGRQPVAVVVSRGKRTAVVDVTEHKRHRRKTAQAASRRS